MYKTAKELREYLANVPDDTPLVIHRSGMEKSGYMQEMVVMSTRMSLETVDTTDAFDGTEYSYERFRKDDNGTPVFAFM